MGSAAANSNRLDFVIDAFGSPVERMSITRMAWAARIGKGMDALYDSGINGIAGSGMIAKGGCVDCSDDEIRVAVDYMVEASR